VLRNALTHSRSVVGWVTFGFVFATMLAGFSLASFSEENRRYAVVGVVLLVAYCLFEGAFLTWRDEARRADKSDDYVRTQQDTAHSVLYSRAQALNSQLILAGHVRRNGMNATTSLEINEFARQVEDWINKTGNAIESAGLDAGPFLADTGDYGAGVWKSSERVELRNAMRKRQLEKLDRHVDRLRAMHARIDDARQALYKKLWGFEE
jgi:hypothetical protein